MTRRAVAERISLYGKRVPRVFAAVCLCVFLGQPLAFPMPHSQSRAASGARSFPPRTNRTPPVANGGNGGPQTRNNQQPHLGQWLQRHQQMSFQDQARAIQQEPGFNRLPPKTQQNLVNRLRQLNDMPPQQRQRTIDRIEAMEHMSPQMRQQVRASVSAFRSLPPEQKRRIGRAFRDLRAFPPDERRAMIDSSQFRSEFSSGDREILTNMLSVEPYRPAPAAGAPEDNPKQP